MNGDSIAIRRKDGGANALSRVFKAKHFFSRWVQKHDGLGWRRFDEPSADFSIPIHKIADSPAFSWASVALRKGDSFDLSVH